MAKKAKKSGEFDRDSVRMCTDVFVPEEDLDKAAELARLEDPTNVIVGLGQAVAEGQLLPYRIAVITAKKWQNGRTLRVGFMGGSSSQQEFVGRIAGQWSQYANIKLEFGSTAAQSDLRVAFRASDGAWSYIGTDNLGIPKSRNTMNLGWLDESVVLHEFGHALGAIHEHQHPEATIPWDVPKVYAYYGGPPNNWNKATIDSNIFGTYSRESTQFSQYDPKSIMHYYIDPKLLTGPSPTPSWNNVLSPFDVKFMSELYPKSVVPPVVVPPTTAAEVALLVAYSADGKELGRYKR